MLPNAHSSNYLNHHQAIDLFKEIWRSDRNWASTTFDVTSMATQKNLKQLTNYCNQKNRFTMFIQLLFSLLRLFVFHGIILSTHKISIRQMSGSLSSSKEFTKSRSERTLNTIALIDATNFTSPQYAFQERITSRNLLTNKLMVAHCLSRIS